VLVDEFLEAIGRLQPRVAEDSEQPVTESRKVRAHSVGGQDDAGYLKAVVDEGQAVPDQLGCVGRPRDRLNAGFAPTAREARNAASGPAAASRVRADRFAAAGVELETLSERATITAAYIRFLPGSAPSPPTCSGTTQPS